MFLFGITTPPVQGLIWTQTWEPGMPAICPGGDVERGRTVPPPGLGPRPERRNICAETVRAGCSLNLSFYLPRGDLFMESLKDIPHLLSLLKRKKIPVVLLHFLVLIKPCALSKMK